MVHDQRPAAPPDAGAARPYWSQVLRALREVRGITQDGWAVQLGFGRSTVKRWESGAVVPSAEAEAAIIRFCHERGLFRRFERGPLQGVTVTPAFLSDLLAEARLPEPPPATAPAPLPPPRRTGAPAPAATAFVGRAPQLGTLLAALRAVQQGHGRLVLLAGEPGIGKTRLLNEVADRAAAAGLRVLHGRAYDAAGMPAYLPFIETLRGAVRDCPPETLAAHLGTGAAEVALLVPELRRLSTLPEHTPLTPEEARYLLFEGVTDFLLALARTPAPRGADTDASGLMLVLDDLHWADAPSLQLLIHLARRLHEGPLLVVGAYRTTDLGRTHPLAATLAELRRERLAERVTLAGLDQAETAALLTVLTGHPPAPAVVAVLQGETDGNPFFVEELTRHLLAEGHDLAAPRGAVADVRIPEGVREVIGQRLSRLSASLNQALPAAAVLGDGVRFELLAATCGMAWPELTDALEEAVAAGVLCEEEGRYHFAHALIRQTVLEELSLPRRQRLHAQAAEAIERVYARALTPHVSALAAHYRLAGAAADPEQAIDASLRAGDVAQATFAHEEAAAHWEGALEVMEQTGVDAGRRAALLERLAQLVLTGGLGRRRGIAHAERALALFEALAQQDGIVRLHISLGDLLFEAGYTQDLERALAHYHAAEAARGPHADGALQAQIANGVASVAVMSLRTEEGLAASRRAIDLAQQARDDAGWANATGLHAHHLFAAGRLAEAWARFEQAWQTADRRNHPHVAYWIAVTAAMDAVHLGDPATTQRWCERELATPRLTQAPFHRRFLRMQLGRVPILMGDLAAAAPLLAEVRGPLLEAEFGLPAGRWEQVAAAAAHFSELSAHGDRLDLYWALHYHARLRWAQGDDAGAAAALREALAIAVDGPHLPYELRVRGELAQLAAEVGRPAEAQPHLVRGREIVAEGEDWRGLAGFLARAEGAVAAAMGRRAEAQTHMQQAITTFKAYALVWEEAETFVAWGRGLLAAGEHAAAVEPLDAALALYQRHGAGEQWAARVLLLREGAIRGTPTPDSPHRPPSQPRRQR